MYDQVEIARVLVEAGADLNAGDARGDTPLHWACVFGAVDMVSTLIDAGADVRALNDAGGTAFNAAATYGHPQLVARLLEADLEPAREGATDLIAAILEGRDITDLLADGADPDASGGDGSTPLRCAVMAGNHDAVGALLAAGADPNASDFAGNTPLHYAAVLGDAETTGLLLDAGAYADEPSLCAIRPLHLAASAAEMEVIEILVDAGADVSARDAWDYTPTGRAARWGHDGIASFIESRGGLCSPRERTMAPGHAIADQ